MPRTMQAVDGRRPGSPERLEIIGLAIPEHGADPERR
jgi:hypothetical protein